jgi:hypothetical protein
MKQIQTVAIIFLMFFVLEGPKLSDAEQWYLGGTLQDATVAQWRIASYDNKLATAAMWAIMEPGIRKVSQRSSSMATVKPYAEELVGCISSMTAYDRCIDDNVDSLAANCMVILGW